MSTHHLPFKTNGKIRLSKTSTPVYGRVTTDWAVRTFTAGGLVVFRSALFSDPTPTYSGRLVFKVSCDHSASWVSGSGSNIALVSLGTSLASDDQTLFDLMDGAGTYASYDMITTGNLLTDLGSQAADDLQTRILDEAEFAVGVRLVAETVTKRNQLGAGAIGGGPLFVLELDALVTTAVASAIGTVNATLGGNVTDDGGTACTERGICWSTSPGVDVGDTVVAMGSGEGAYSQVVTGLPTDQVIYYRSYCVTAHGVFYGDELSFRTIQARSTGDNCFGFGPKYLAGRTGGAVLTFDRGDGDNQIVPDITRANDKRATGDNQGIGQPLA